MSAVLAKRFSDLEKRADTVEKALAVKDKTIAKMSRELVANRRQLQQMRRQNRRQPQQRSRRRANAEALLSIAVDTVNYVATNPQTSVVMLLSATVLCGGNPASLLLTGACHVASTVFSAMIPTMPTFGITAAPAAQPARRWLWPFPRS